MRRKEFEVTEPEALRAILDECKVCRVAVRDSEGMYIVPMNFGYQMKGQSLTLYFHSAKEGRKVDAFAKDGSVAFEMDCGHELIAREKACAYSYAYKSIIGDGIISTVDDPEQKKETLSILMRHQSGKEFTFTDEMASTVLVFKLESTHYTGKQIDD